MPFGPFLAAAGWLAMMWGPQWVAAYLGLYGGSSQTAMAGSPMRVALTGGIASGKSTVAGAVCGAGRADHRHGRDRARGGRTRQRAAARRCSSASGPACARPMGASIARRCASSCSAMRRARAELEAMLHPAIRARAARARAARARPLPDHRDAAAGRDRARRASTIGCWWSTATKRLQRSGWRSATAAARPGRCGAGGAGLARRAPGAGRRRHRQRRRRSPRSSPQVRDLHASTCSGRAQADVTAFARASGSSTIADERVRHAPPRLPRRSAHRLRAAAERADAHLPAPGFPLQPGALPQRQGEQLGEPRRDVAACSTSWPSRRAATCAAMCSRNSSATWRCSTNTRIIPASTRRGCAR